MLGLAALPLGYRVRVRLARLGGRIKVDSEGVELEKERWPLPWTWFLRAHLIPGGDWCLAAQSVNIVHAETHRVSWDPAWLLGIFLSSELDF